MANQHNQVPLNSSQGLHSYIETSAELIGSAHDDLDEVQSGILSFLLLKLTTVDSDSGQPPVDARPTIREAKWSEVMF